MSIIPGTEYEGLPLIRQGKVRDIFDTGDALLMVTTDRLSAFDVVLPDAIPDKGKVRVQVSLFGRPTSVELDYTQLKGF